MKLCTSVHLLGHCSQHFFQCFSTSDCFFVGVGLAAAVCVNTVPVCVHGTEEVSCLLLTSTNADTVVHSHVFRFMCLVTELRLLTVLKVAPYCLYFPVCFH